MIDLTPTTSRATALVAGVDEARLDAPTPMGTTVTELLHHLLGLSLAFRDAAAKLEGPTTSTPPRPITEPLPADWRSRLPDRLADLAAAWGHPSAWEGETMVGGVRLPAEIAGLVALDEVLLHGWDLATATGQEYRPSEEEAEAVLPIVTPDPDPEQAAAQRDGVFGAPVPVPENAPLFERVLGLAGRDPGWRVS